MKNLNSFRNIMLLFSLLFLNCIATNAAVGVDSIAIHSLGHASLYFEYNGLIIHVDPNSAQGNYNSMPDADLIFITHEHGDHYDLGALNLIKKETTVLVTTQTVKNLGTYTGTIQVIKNGESIVINGIPVDAVPAYNIVSSTIYHPKGVGNGYILTFGEKRIYIAGDTEDIPEMDTLGIIDIAFLPMNLPYTMPVSMAVEAAKSVMPDILYIYHFGSSDTASLRSQLSDQDMEIRMGKSVYTESDKRTGTGNLQKTGDNNPVYFYPNPVKDFLTINNPNMESSVVLYDIAGKLVMKKQKVSTGNNFIDMQYLKAGLYVIEIQSKFHSQADILYKE